jgi:hypothetical protein
VAIAIASSNRAVSDVAGESRSIGLDRHLRAWRRVDSISSLDLRPFHHRLLGAVALPNVVASGRTSSRMRSRRPPPRPRPR